MAPWADPMPTAEAEEAFLRDRMGAFDADEDWGYFLLEPDAGELLGGAGLHPKTRGIVEIGYWVRSDRTGRVTPQRGQVPSRPPPSITSLRSSG